MPSLVEPVSVWLVKPGCLGSDEVAARLASMVNRDRLVWLRVIDADRYPGVFPSGVFRSVAHHAPALAAEVANRFPTPEAMALLDSVRAARALAELAPDGFTMVIEHRTWGPPSPAVTDFIAEFRAAERSSVLLLVLVESRCPRRTLRRLVHCHVERVGRRYQGRSVGDPAMVDRFAALAGLARGRLALAREAAAIADGPTARLVDEALCRSASWRGFSRRLTAALLDRAGPAEVEALCIALWTGSVEPDVDEAGTDDLRPWLMPLDGGGHCLRPAWSRVLARQLAVLARHRQPMDRRRSASLPLSARRALARTLALGDERSARTQDVAAAVPVESHIMVEGGEAAGGHTSRHKVVVRLFGPFELEVDGRPVEAWRGQRGLSVLKYLLAHPKRTCARDTLLGVFWPDADPKRARNRLHVALSSVRRAVRAVADVELIEHGDGMYRLPANIELDIDVNHYGRLIEEGRQAQLARNATTACDSYGEAVRLYRGDLLADDPYESWTTLPREALRIEYLAVLDRLAELHIAAGRIGECVETALRILAQDSCREDAHRLLMRCYAQQGRVAQVDRQYEFCRRMLADRLGISPSHATLTLYRDVRATASDAGSDDWNSPRGPRGSWSQKSDLATGTTRN